jgi:hypothetical protein
MTSEEVLEIAHGIHPAIVTEGRLTTITDRAEVTW